MKRCSQCDFIYEDDQHLCDMDGHELVYEPTLQSLQLTVPTKTPTQTVNSGARRQLLAAAVAILIATVLSVGYSGFTSEYAPHSSKAPSTDIIAAPQPAPAETPVTPAVSPSPSPSQSPGLENPRVSPTSGSPIAMSAPGFRSDAPRRETRSQPAKANHKKESGIGGFLKKTGKLLKKPFQR